MPLRDILVEVLETNPRILERVKDYNASVYEKEAGKAGRYPTLDVQADTGHQEVANFFSRFQASESLVSSTRLSARQLLFDGGRNKSQVQSLSAKARSALYGYFESANQVSFETIETYILILKFIRLTAIAQESVEIHERLLLGVKQRVQAGIEGRSELERVVGRLAAAQSAYVSRLNDLKREVYNLQKHLGRFVDSADLIRPEFDESILPVDLADAFNRQQENHPTLQVAHHNIKLREWEYWRERSDYNPLLFLEATKDWQKDFNGIQGTQEDQRALVKMQYNVFDGFGRQNRSERARSLVHREFEAMDRVKRALINDIQLTWTSYKLLKTQIGAVTKNVVFTRRALRAYKEEFKLGTRLLINILDAEQEYQTARGTLASLQHDLQIQKFRVLYSMGTLVPDLQLDIPYGERLAAKQGRPIPASKDPLPFDSDLDDDAIVDRFDLSVNSVEGSEVVTIGETNHHVQAYMQEPQRKEVAQALIKAKVELRENPLKQDVPAILELVSFVAGTTELTPDSKILMREVIEQVSPLAVEGIVQITVATTEMGSEAENYSLALRRAYNIKKIFTDHEMDPDGIQVFGTHESQNRQHSNFISLQVVTDPENIQEAYDLIVSQVEFEPGKVSLPPGANQELTDLAGYLRSEGLPDMEIVVRASEHGDSGKNLQLAEERAGVLKAILTGLGIPGDKIVPVGWGDHGSSVDVGRSVETDGSDGSGAPLLTLPSGSGAASGADAGVALAGGLGEESPNRIEYIVRRK